MRSTIALAVVIGAWSVSSSEAQMPLGVSPSSADARPRGVVEALLPEETTLALRTSQQHVGVLGAAELTVRIQNDADVTRVLPRVWMQPTLHSEVPDPNAPQLILHLSGGMTSEGREPQWTDARSIAVSTYPLYRARTEKRSVEGTERVETLLFDSGHCVVNLTSRPVGTELEPAEALEFELAIGARLESRVDSEGRTHERDVFLFDGSGGSVSVQLQLVHQGKTIAASEVLTLVGATETLEAHQRQAIDLLVEEGCVRDLVGASQYSLFGVGNVPQFRRDAIQSSRPQLTDLPSAIALIDMFDSCSRLDAVENDLRLAADGVPLPTGKSLRSKVAAAKSAVQANAEATAAFPARVALQLQRAEALANAVEGLGSRGG